MIIGKFLDPCAPSLPQQVGENTDDIAEILQENEEQSANIQKNTDDIELLKQQVSESGTRVRVDGELVAEWSPDELTDDLQQLRLAQSSDSLAIVGLQSDNITNKNNITKLNAETLKTPLSPPANTELVGIGINNAQVNISVGNGINIDNGVISSNLEMDLLWKNPNTTSYFGGQTITVANLSNYNTICVLYKSNYDSRVKSIGYAFGRNEINNGINFTFIEDKVAGRFLYVESSTTINFGEAYLGNATTNNGFCIPIKLYGLNIKIKE